MSAKMKAR